MVDALSAAAEPTRRRILQLLAAGPRPVSALAAEFTVTRSAVSQHLLVLVDGQEVHPRTEPGEILGHQERDVLAIRDGELLTLRHTTHPLAPVPEP